MKNFSITVNKIEDGILHVKSAGLMVKETTQYVSDVKVEKNGYTINGKDIIGWMGLKVNVGDKLAINIEGPDEEIAVDALQNYFQNVYA